MIDGVHGSGLDDDWNLTRAVGVLKSVADAMAYEWPAIVHRWDGLIEALIAEIQKA